MTQITNLDKKKPLQSSIYDQITQTYIQRAKPKIIEFKEAVQVAESIINPRRYLLSRIYRQIYLDPHLEAVIGQRKSLTLSKPFQVVDVEGNENPELTKIFKEEWFYRFLDYALDSIFEGFSLIAFGDIINDKYSSIHKIPMEYTCPEKGVIFTSIGDSKGIDYSQPPYSNWCIPVKSNKNLGILLSAVPSIFWKFQTLSAWAEYSEKFGMPLRVGKTQVQDPEQKKNMVDMMKNMGSSTWAVIDSSDNVEFVASNSTDAYQVFLEFANFLDTQVSKRILGQTGTTDEKSFSGSANVHAEVLNLIGSSDSKNIEFLVNNQLIPMMISHGFPLTGYRWKFDYSEKVSIEKQFEFVEKLLPYKDIPDDWILKTFGVPVTQKAESTQPLGGGDKGKSPTGGAN